jgi:ADP-ribose pyrophosphatase
MKILSSEEVYRCPIFWVTWDRALDPNGFQIQRAVVQHSGSAVVMLVDRRRQVLLVRQYRLPARKYLWELPAGRMDPGETPLQSARRELREETGFTARKWSKLVSYYASPGFLAEKMNIFLAEEPTEGNATPMEDERIESRWFSIRELHERVAKGTLEDGKTIAALAAYQWRRKRIGE